MLVESVHEGIPRRLVNHYRPGEKKLGSSFKSCPFVEYDKIPSPVLAIKGSIEEKVKASVGFEGVSSWFPNRPMYSSSLFPDDCS